MSFAPLIERAGAAFERRFGALPTRWVQAPGRVNLIGEHTDYNDGFVLPCAIDRATVIALAPRSDPLLRVVAADLDDALDSFRLDADISRRGAAPWTDYVRGMAQQLVGAGHAQGLDLAIAGNVPQGAGLSSSASLMVALGQAFQTAAPASNRDRLDGRALALLAQRAENHFVGTQCGIMDPLISACGEAGRALLIDCRSLATRAVALPGGAAVLIAHSMVRRGLVESAYNERRAACEAAALFFGVPALRDVDDAMLRAANGLDATALRRARHVVSENARTLAAAEALAGGDLASMGRLMAASHASMRDDFEITVPAIDQLVELIGAHIGDQGGVRMTGGGFGGCVVALLPEARVAAVREAIAAGYRSPSGEVAAVHVCRASVGAGAL
jgi:galactokinase